MGNIAPDSGIPKADGTGYLPDAELSHFRTIDQNGIKDVHEDWFIERFFTEAQREHYDAGSYAFYFGYLTHLLTDKLWAIEIGYGAKNRFPDLFDRDQQAFWKKIKRDWYDMDFLYLKKVPDFEAFQIYESMDVFPNIYVDFFSENAFESRRQFITGFYRDGVNRVKDRGTYLSMEELDTFVASAIERILEQCAVYAAELVSRNV